MLLLWGLWTFERFWESPQHEPTRAFNIEKPLVSALGGSGSQDITRVGPTVLGGWHLPAGSVRGGLSKGTMASTSTFVWDKAAPPTLNRKPDFLPISAWCLLSCCEGAGA